MEFFFSCSTRHLTRSLRSLVSYQVKHSKRNSSNEEKREQTTCYGGCRFHLWIFKKQERVSQAYEMFVSKKRVYTKRTTLHFFVRNGERFPLLLETNNAFRIVTQTYFNSEHTIDFCVVKVFMVLLETKKKFLKLTKRP